MGRREEFLPSQTEGESSKHPPGQIFLYKVDLWELVVVGFRNERSWHPGHKIQISDFVLAQDDLVNQARRNLIASGRYIEKIKGHQTILLPGYIDETVRAAIELGGIASLEPLIRIFSQFSEIISSATLLLNTSLGVVDRRTGFYPNKINGVIIEVNISDGRLKPQVAQLVNQMRWPFGRAISVVGLQGIDINSFVLHFGEGDDLKAGVLGKGVKFVDFYFGPNGEMYSIFAAGGERGLSDDFFTGTKREVEQRLSDLLVNQEALHQQINQVIVSRIGGGVNSEEVVFGLPYVGAYFDPEKGLLLVSGACLNEGSLFFNQGPNNPGILIPGGELLHPVGIKLENLVTRVGAEIIPKGQFLTPVRQFGLL
jgi:hypothetical protein